MDKLTYKLRDLGEYKNGANYPKGSYGEGDKIVNVKDLFRGRYVSFDGLDELKPNALKNKKIYLVEDGDLLFTRSSLVKSGAGMVAMIKDPKEDVLFCGFIIRYRPNKSKVYPLYLLYLLRSPNYRKLFTDGSAQTNISNINQDTLGNIEVELPSVDDQKKIVEIIDLCDKKIELNQRINAELESMAKTLYDYWFVQFDFPNEKGKPYKSAGGKMVWNEELKREIPLGWEICELRKYVTANRGLSYSGKHITGGGVPMINLNSFNMAEGSYKPEGIKTYSGEYGNHKILKPFDLVMCNTQQTALDPKKDIIGKSFLVPDIFETDIVSSHHVTTVTVEKENLKYYLNSLFNTGYFHRYISGYATGTNILGLNFEGVLSYKTAIPSDDLLDRYKAIVVNVEKQKARIIKETQTLTELRDWLLPMLMNGQVKVG